MNNLNRKAIIFVLGFTSFTAHATTIEFRQDTNILLNNISTGILYTGTQDAELRQDAPDTNFDFGTGSSDPEFTVDGSDGGFVTQAVLRFDGIFGNGPGQIPLGSTINSASLFIDIDNNGDNLELFRLSTDFGDETTVTYNNIGSANDGVNVGVDTIGSAIIVDGQGDKLSIDVTEALILWSNGATNYGWAFIPTGNDGVDFDASENSDPSDRPALTIDFTAPAPVPVPAAVWLFVSALGGLGLARRPAKLS